MTTKSTLVLIVLIAIASTGWQAANAQANTKLSNLVNPTTINQSLSPNNDSIKNLGTAAKSWGSAYLYQLNVRKNKAGNGSILNANGIELGYGVSGKEVNAGKIGYSMFTPNTLDIVGAGNTSSTRAIKFFAEAGSTFRGNINVSHHSSISIPQLLLSETQNDYSRLNFTNTATTNFYAIAAIPQATTANAKLNFYYSATEDIMTITGDGRVGIGNLDGITKLNVLSPLSNGNGLIGEANNGTAAWGVVGRSSSGEAGHFSGNVTVSGTFNNPSDQRLKENIKPVEKMLDKVMLLKPSLYNFKKEYSKMNLPKGEQMGFIAQDMEKVFPRLVNTIAEKQSDNGKVFEYKGINYIGLIPLLTKAIQEQQEEIAALKQEVKNLAANAAISENTSAAKTVSASDAVLNQNVPNPFSGNTSIQYNIPAHFKSAQLVIADANGAVVRQVALTSSGKGTININAYNLSSGTYTYSLLVDGNTVETKKMIIGK